MTGSFRISDRVRRGIAGLIEPLIVVAVMLLSTSAIAQPFYIPSGSMEPTLSIGDYLVATKYSYGYSRYSLPFDLGPSSEERLWGRMPKRGDVPFSGSRMNLKVNFVKRVIGLPGDRVAMRGGRLFLNGKIVPQKFTGEALVEFGDGHFETVTATRKHCLAANHIPSTKCAKVVLWTTPRNSACRPGIFLRWGTTATTRSIAALARVKVEWDTCRSKIWSAKRSEDRQDRCVSRVAATG